MHVKSIDHIHIYAADPAASVEFFCRHFGAQKVFETKNAHHQQVSILQVGGQGIALSEYPPGTPPKTPALSEAEAREGMGPAAGIMHLGFNVEDVAAAVRELRDAGVRVHTEPDEAYGTTFAYCSTPDGVVIELTQY